jgi:hypothetical protein
LWTQNVTPLPAFNAGDFQIETVLSTFIRATGGDGTAANPYLLTDIYGLQGLGSAGMATHHYRLATDIDAAGTRAWTGSLITLLDVKKGQGFKPITGIVYLNPFGTTGLTGSLDGDGHTISNLFMRYTGLSTGLIAMANAATITNLNLTGVDITGASLWVGGLVGDLKNGASVTHCHVSGTVKGASEVGGLVGRSQASHISDSSAAVTVRGNIAVGGLVGDAGGGSTITASRASGAVTGDQAVGGLIGLVGTGGASIERVWPRAPSPCPRG